VIRLQRYLLGELLASFALVLLIVTSIFFGGMLLKFLHSAAGLSLVAVLQGAPYLLPLALPLTAPFALLIACLLTYGRFADDNEFTALRMGGVHPWNAVAPAVCVGALLSIGTLFLNTDVIPLATLGKKVVARDEVGRLVLAVQRQDSGDLRLGKKFRISWSGRRDRWLQDVLMTFERERENPDGSVEETTHHANCGEARLRVAGEQLVVDVHEMHTDVVGSGGAITQVYEKDWSFSLPVSQITSRSPTERPKGQKEMRASELYYRIQRGTDEDLVHEYEAQYWHRMGLGLAPLAFALLGAPLGLATARGSRMFSVVLALVVALPVYHPLLRLGERLASAGTVPAPLALNLGNVLLAAVGLFVLTRVVRI
jgi:lipopolysaccharide export LptBFGC system permease protein LptF